MLKKIFILLLSINVCAAENTKKPENSESNHSAMKVIGLGVVIWAVHTVIPKLLEDSSCKHLSTLAGAALGVYGISQLCVIGGETYENIYPNEATKTGNAEARKIIAEISAKRAFRSCLMKNACKKRNASGIPTQCENLARMYEVTAGKFELDAMITLFKKAYEN